MGMASRFPDSFKKFSCINCGKCCTLTVKPTNEDIRKIEMLGYDRKRFLRNGNLAKVNGACCFLEKRDGGYFCSIHEMKPKVCRQYPFTNLKNDNLFSCPALRI
ncbi:MAG: hypothetical protein DRO99_00515 [Candidatus Aenigmatarchaeota archaeon]|nr:MAG: hypothetical protein DRO99_00515 [Candidatus Aenigmarchaeota archaeon]